MVHTSKLMTHFIHYDRSSSYNNVYNTIPLSVRFWLFFRFKKKGPKNSLCLAYLTKTSLDRSILQSIGLKELFLRRSVVWKYGNSAITFMLNGERLL